MDASYTLPSFQYRKLSTSAETSLKIELKEPLSSFRAVAQDALGKGPCSYSRAIRVISGITGRFSKLNTSKLTRERENINKLGSFLLTPNKPKLPELPGKNQRDEISFLDDLTRCFIGIFKPITGSGEADIDPAADFPADFLLDPILCCAEYAHSHGMTEIFNYFFSKIANTPAIIYDNAGYWFGGAKQRSKDLKEFYALIASLKIEIDGLKNKVNTQAPSQGAAIQKQDQSKELLIEQSNQKIQSEFELVAQDIRDGWQGDAADRLKKLAENFESNFKNVYKTLPDKGRTIRKGFRKKHGIYMSQLDPLFKDLAGGSNLVHMSYEVRSLWLLLKGFDKKTIEDKKGISCSSFNAKTNYSFYYDYIGLIMATGETLKLASSTRYDFATNGIVAQITSSNNKQTWARGSLNKAHSVHDGSIIARHTAQESSDAINRAFTARKDQFKLEQQITNAATKLKTIDEHIIDLARTYKEYEKIGKNNFAAEMVKGVFYPIYKSNFADPENLLDTDLDKAVIRFIKEIDRDVNKDGIKTLEVTTPNNQQPKQSLPIYFRCQGKMIGLYKLSIEEITAIKKLNNEEMQVERLRKFQKNYIDAGYSKRVTKIPRQKIP